MIPRDKIKYLVDRYINLEKEFSLGTINKKEFASKSKEYSDLKEIVNQAKDYLNFEDEKLDLEKIINDKKNDGEMKDMAKNELKKMIEKKEINEKKTEIIFNSKR